MRKRAKRAASPAAKGVGSHRSFEGFSLRLKEFVTQKSRKAQKGSPAANGLGHTDYTDFAAAPHEKLLAVSMYH